MAKDFRVQGLGLGGLGLSGSQPDDEIEAQVVTRSARPRRGWAYFEGFRV